MFKQQYIKDKNFILLFFGSLVSGIGSRMYGFGISLYLLDLTGLATSMATYIAIWTFVIFVLSPIAATFTDRWKKKVRVLYITDFGRGIIYFITGISVYYFNDIGNSDLVLTTIYGLLIFIAVQTAFFSPASSALIPQIVPSDELVSASSLFQLTRSLQTFAGLALGAFLYANYGIVILIIINAISFIFSGISEMFIKYDTAMNQDRLNESAYEEEEIIIGNKLIYYCKRIYSDLKEAAIYIFRDAKPIAAVVYIIVISLTMADPYFSLGVPYIIKEYLTFENFDSNYILAMSESALSIGIMIMSFIVAASLGAKLKIHQLLKIAGILFLIIAVSYLALIKLFDYNIIEENTFLVLFIGANFIFGLTNALLNAPLNAAITKYVDPNKIGKVVTMMDSFGGILLPFTLLLSGVLIDNVSVYIVVYSLIIAIILINLIIFTNKYLKEL
ncbi:MAG: 2-acyl-glycerophospho-ethanolamine acyltransferase [Candidatus Izimaplasma bacterium HR2]|nr:MAG: 2-acyl-glycerophospho-ethanolamine acyltransferase [Candidatus Izimaplasma bacterium HR2]